MHMSTGATSRARGTTTARLETVLVAPRRRNHHLTSRREGRGGGIRGGRRRDGPRGLCTSVYHPAGFHSGMIHDNIHIFLHIVLAAPNLFRDVMYNVHGQFEFLE